MDRRRSLYSKIGVINVQNGRDHTEIYYRDRYKEHLDICYNEEIEQRDKQVAEKVRSINKQTPTKTLEDDDSDDSGIEIPSKHEVCSKDFILHDKIGRGSFGEILCVSIIGQDTKYAMKCLSKCEMMKSNMLRFVMQEKKIMTNFDHPFLVKLHFSFQNAT